MEFDRVEKPVRELRKMLKDLPQNPAPDEVHKLRTRTRRVEAIASALEPAAQKRTRQLLKALKPVRKAAGGVRDMDVLTAGLLNLTRNSNEESIVRLIEHLGTLRSKSADDLLDTVAEQRKPARRHLKEYARVIESVAAGKKPVRSEGSGILDSEDGTGSAAGKLIAEFTSWPALNADNLHDFRLRVKELRYVLQMFPDSDSGFIDALGQVKDDIGEWHDWQQLAEIARKVLDPRHDSELLAKIKGQSKQKFTRALKSSNSLRRRYLSVKARQSKAS